MVTMENITMKYENEFTEWIYETQSVYNGDTLLNYLEDVNLYNTFLSDMGLVDE